MNSSYRPTQAQTDAADPAQSVWVTANAGSGKTHVLVERVIRLLLDGVDPAALLCITFTKAAAAEMSTRLSDRLSGWTALSDDDLNAELQNMGLKQPESHHLLIARRLFTRVLETPGGLKIQTIHAFCERLLQLFPVEAGMAPGFRVLDDRMLQDMRDEAKFEVLRGAESGAAHHLTDAYATVIDNSGSSETFDHLIASFLSGAKKLRRLLSTDLNRGGFELALKRAAQIELDLRAESLASEIEILDLSSYEHHANVLAKHGKFGRIDFIKMMRAVVNEKHKTQALRELYFIQSSPFTPRKAFMSKAAQKEDPQTLEFLTSEQTRLEALFLKLDMLKRIEATSALFVLAKEIFQKVESRKRLLGLYDFDDLIERTSELLQNTRSTQWVLKKLDSGLQHILLDEAQDTSPAQWTIILALAEEFFAGAGRPLKSPRTLFVVGDRKQSIYSFQGADAQTYAAARRNFMAFVAGQQKRQNQIELTISYRSTEAILDAVNEVFPANNPQRLGFAADDMAEQDHTTNRAGAIGKVELWPLVLPLEKGEEPDHWKVPLDRVSAQSSKRRLARQIAQTIKGWVGQRMLASLNRYVTPSDIMILLQSRGPLFSMLIAELRKIGVPVAGADRLKLRESLVIQDLLMLGQFLSLPDDDYALACILKSPFVPDPVSEDQLFEIAHGRATKTLWERVQARENKNVAWLQGLLNRASNTGPYQFFSYVLARYRKAMLARLGPEAGDATDAFLDQALGYGVEHGPSLFGFCRWFGETETEIKRELEKTAGEVRLITVHGAKGLEANIVILPDAASIPKGRNESRILILPEGSEASGMPLWMLSDLMLTPELTFWKQQDQAKLMAERNRLLYVAMTRARDELYICGAQGKKNIAKDCWYATVEAELDVTSPGEQTVEVASAMDQIVSRPTTIPTWVSTNAEASTGDKRQVSSTPSHNPEGDPAQLERGTILHSILQKAPEIDPARLPAFAKAQAKKYKLDEGAVMSLVTLVQSPDLAPFFGPHSQSEKDIAGYVADRTKPVLGRVDRLVVNEREVLLLDFKTDRYVPERSAIDHPYVRQMSLYVALLQKAYPNHLIRAALLWTQTGKLEWLSPEILATARDHLATNLEAPAS